MTCASRIATRREPVPLWTFAGKLTGASRQTPRFPRPLDGRGSVRTMANRGAACSQDDLLQLRTGERHDQNAPQVQALATIFDVPLSYFVGTDEQVDTVGAHPGLAQVHPVRVDRT